MMHTAAAHQTLDVSLRRLLFFGQHVFEHRIKVVILHQSLGGRLGCAQRTSMSGARVRESEMGREIERAMGSSRSTCAKRKMWIQYEQSMQI